MEIWSALQGPPDASLEGESEVQLCEQRSYEYRLDGEGLVLRCPLAKRSERANPGEDFGRIDTGNFVGNLHLEVVRPEAPDVPVGSTFLTVRSEKLEYRTHYRGMLRYLAQRFEAMILEARSASRMTWQTDLSQRLQNPAWVQLQLEFLRQTLTDAEFWAAVHRVTQFPHERVVAARSQEPVGKSARLSAAEVRQLASRQPRCTSPPNSHLARIGLDTLPVTLEIARKSLTTDTPENRFVRDVLRSFELFLERISAEMAGESWADVRREAHLLRKALAETLARPFFAELAESAHVPLASPVLQRRPGYREVFRAWLQYQSLAHLSWSAAQDVFSAGQRDVAALYEYWLFFVLLQWFEQACGVRFSPEQLFSLDALELKLQKGKRLGPFVAEIAPSGRRMLAAFSFNTLFPANRSSSQRGTWTRSLRPDYTFTFWPANLSEEDAERLDMLVHVHFDAKYRIEGLDALFGGEEDPGDEQGKDDRVYKRQDLLKMHAYRDAIRRSEGAYVLFPGEKGEQFRGFQEILPGLGAFAIRPGPSGEPEGLEDLERFLLHVLDHLGRRGTARERLRYHRYKTYVREVPTEYVADPAANRSLDSLGEPLAPPAETVVLVAWVQDDAQLEDVRKGKYYVRLGRRRGSLRLTPLLAAASKVLLRGKSKVLPGLYAITDPGMQVMTCREMIDAGFGTWAEADANDDWIYGVFDIAPDPDFTDWEWDSAELKRCLESFEKERLPEGFTRLGRSSSLPRVLTLDYLLPALLPSRKP
ncbi:MAG: DUF2357 domain-containing protein [Fimbriimonadales bacterium]|nr:DUF2357 domain-containing protein [Fimbriimonadales bacterium]